MTNTARMMHILNVTAAGLGLALLISACGGQGGGDSSAPVVQVSSPTTTGSDAYELSGTAVDNVGVTGLTYTLGGGDAQPLELADGSFSEMLTLAAGDNEITVTATDAEGNTGTDSLTVTYGLVAVEMTADTDIAARGAAVTVSGNDLGDSGTVLVGGVEAIVDAWDDGEVTFTVPDDAPGGPQTVIIESAGGGGSFELFVGVDFEAGTLEELAALGLPKGTAVRLGAGTFSQSTPEVVLDNLSLYGRSLDDTIVDSGDLPQTLVIQVDTGYDIVIQDLHLITDSMLVTSAEPGPIEGAALTDVDLSLDSIVANWSAQAQLDTMSADAGSLTLRGLVIDENMGGFGILTVDVAAGKPYGGSVNVINVQQVVKDSVLVIVCAGDVTLYNAAILNSGHVIASISGDVSMSAVGAYAGKDSVLRLDSGILAAGAIDISDTLISARISDRYELGSTAVFSGGSSIAPGAADNITITDSFLLIRGVDPLANVNAGSLIIGAAGTNHAIRGNLFDVDGDLGLVLGAGELDFDGNQVILGHPDILASDLIVAQLSMAPNYVDMRNNEVKFTSPGSLTLTFPGGQTIQGNTFTGDGSVAVVIDESSSENRPDVHVLDNTFTNFTWAISVVLAGAADEPANIVFNGNVFDFPIDTAGKVAKLYDVVNATIDADGNRWGELDDLNMLNAYVLSYGATPPDIMEINSVMP